MKTTAQRYQPQISNAGLAPTHQVTAMDEQGQIRELQVAGESPLTLKVDGHEVVTLMTLGTHPEALALGYLRNQRLLEQISDISAVQVDWDREQVNVSTHNGQGIIDWEQKLSGRTITTGCGQGTVFSCTLEKLYDRHMPDIRVKQSMLYALLAEISHYNDIYKQAGAVHGCALCQDTDILMFVEDVGRHNAADAIAGMMWLDDIHGDNKIFYTTGRLTSEMVMKAAEMRIPLLLSRSGVTHMGLELARDLGITMIARAKGRHFLVYNGADNIQLDARPQVIGAERPQPRNSLDVI